MVLVSVVGALWWSAVALACPPPCECKWRSGKEAVACIAANLSALPPDIDAGTQILDLTGNSLTTVPHDAFNHAGLVNLQKVYLSKCRLKTLDRYAFRKLTNLVELDLSYNHLPSVPSHVFDSISELRDLKLNGNPIQRIVNDAFINVPHLTRLELSNCRLGTVEARAFSGVEHSLEWLKLDHNRLVDLKANALSGMKNLHGLELAGNPWNCTCVLRSLREWMMQQNVPYNEPPLCKFPQRLAGKPWDKLEIDEFACKPEVSALQTSATSVEGNNVTMSCEVKGIPEPRVRWLWRNRIITNLSMSTSGLGRVSGGKIYLLRSAERASNLTILGADMGDAGTYICTAENKAGRVEATITLAVSRRPPEESTLSGRVVAAGIVVAALFALTAALVALCACNSKRGQHHGAPTMAQAAAEEASYEKIEMNHKASLPNNHHHHQPAVVDQPHPRHSEYRGVPTDEDDEADQEEGGYEDEIDTPTPTSLPSSKMWSGAVRSPSNMPEGRSPEQTDLHIPRLTERREPLLSPVSVNTPLTRKDFNIPETVVAHHVMRKQPVGTTGCSLYTSEPVDNFPDLLEVSPGGSTLPRRRPPFRPSRGSDSQSPLLPDSRRASIDSYSSRRHPQRSSSSLNLASAAASAPPPVRPRGRNPSLPTSPVRETPLLNLVYNTYDYHAAQLERFLEEYRSLQEQLCRMKETCENIRHEPRTPEDNPKSILKNKPCSSVSVTASSAVAAALPSVATPLGLSSGGAVDYGTDLPPYWVPRTTLIRRMSGGDFYQS